MTSILDIVPPCNGIGNPKVVVTFAHPLTNESITLRIGMTSLYLTPAYTETILNARERWRANLPFPYVV
jgi:hypothetical protein